MKIRVKFFAYFRELFEAKHKLVVLADGSTVAELLRVLCDTPERRAEIFDKNGLRPDVVLMKNEMNVQSQKGLRTGLEEGDVLAIFPLIGGG
jgi:MoaD family protein